MPTIVFASPKGGCGKSTAVILLATELALKGASITVLDTDDNKPIALWQEMGRVPESLTVLSGMTEQTILDDIEAAARTTAFVIVDLEGTASLMAAYAASRADLVIIPTQGSALDAREASKTIKLIHRQEKAFTRKIPYAILYTRTSPALKPRTLQDIQRQFITHGVRAFQTHVSEREAYKAIFSFGGTLEALDPKQVSNLDAAIVNARAFAAETIHILKSAEPEVSLEAGVA